MDTHTYHFCAMSQQNVEIKYFDGLIELTKPITADFYSELKAAIGQKFNPPIDSKKVILLSISKM